MNPKQPVTNFVNDLSGEDLLCIISQEPGQRTKSQDDILRSPSWVDQLGALPMGTQKEILGRIAQKEVNSRFKTMINADLKSQPPSKAQHIKPRP